MTKLNHRHQILESLNSLDPAQTQKVLEYIHSLTSSRNDLRRQVQKSKAMTEIRQALNNSRSMHAA